MSDDAVEIVARAIDPYYSRSSDISKLAISSLCEAGYAIVPAATIAQRDATIEREREWNRLRGLDLMSLTDRIGQLREALRPFAERGSGLAPIWEDHETQSNGDAVTVGDLRAARAAYDATPQASAPSEGAPPAEPPEFAG